MQIWLSRNKEKYERKIFRLDKIVKMSSEKRLVCYNAQTALEFEVVAIFLAGAWLNACKAWCLQGMKQYSRLCVQGIHSLKFVLDSNQTYLIKAEWNLMRLCFEAAQSLLLVKWLTSALYCIEFHTASNYISSPLNDPHRALLSLYLTIVQL